MPAPSWGRWWSSSPRTGADVARRPRLIALALVLAVLLAALPAAAEREGGGITAGAARVEIPIPSGTPLAGYGAAARRRLVPDVFSRWPHAFWFKSHDGRDDPIVARAVSLVAGGRRVVWVTADLVAVDRSVTDEVTTRVQRALGGSPTVVVSATHTHSGPGAFVDSEAMALVAVDRLDRVVREIVVTALVDAATRADARRVPARLGAGRTEVADVTRPRLDAAIDRQLVVMKLVAADGTPIALVWNFAIHPTMLGPRNLRLSGDVTGATSGLVERKLGVPALFVNGAVGDVSPRRHGREALVEVGGRLAGAVESLWSRIDARPVPGPVVSATATVPLGSAALPVRNCLGGWLPRAMTLPLGSLFPSEAILTAVAVGDVAWVTVPGELQSALGARIKHAVKGRWPHAFVAGLSNGYLGYFVARTEFDAAAYVTCASLYGPEAGERLAEAAAALLRGVGGQR